MTIGAVIAIGTCEGAVSAKPFTACPPRRRQVSLPTSRRSVPPASLPPTLRLRSSRGGPSSRSDPPSASTALPLAPRIPAPETTSSLRRPAAAAAVVLPVAHLLAADAPRTPPSSLEIDLVGGARSGAGVVAVVGQESRVAAAGAGRPDAAQSGGVDRGDCWWMRFEVLIGDRQRLLCSTGCCGGWMGGWFVIDCGCGGCW